MVCDMLEKLVYLGLDVYCTIPGSVAGVLSESLCLNQLEMLALIVVASRSTAPCLVVISGRWLSGLGVHIVQDVDILHILLM